MGTTASICLVGLRICSFIDKFISGRELFPKTFSPHILRSICSCTERSSYFLSSVPRNNKFVSLSLLDVNHMNASVFPRLPLRIPYELIDIYFGPVHQGSGGTSSPGHPIRGLY